MSVVVPVPVLLRLPRVVMVPRLTLLLKFNVRASPLPLNTACDIPLFKLVPVSVIGVIAKVTVPA